MKFLRSASCVEGTSGDPRRTKLIRYRCSLPGLAGFAGNRRTEPEVPPIREQFSRRKLRNANFARCRESSIPLAHAKAVEAREAFSILRERSRNIDHAVGMKSAGFGKATIQMLSGCSLAAPMRQQFTSSAARAI